MHKPFIITIVGAESSGKTKLVTQLAEYLDCPWVPEYAREYLSLLGRPYNEADLEIIADRQLETILAIINCESSAVNRESSKLNWQSTIGNRQPTLTPVDPSSPDLQPTTGPELKNLSDDSKPKIVIIDGGMMNLRMWAMIKYKKTIPVVEESLKNDVTDLYLLCRPHKKWKPDPLREAPSLMDRAWIFNKYLDELLRGGIRTEILYVRSGKKITKAIQKIELFIQQENKMTKTG